MIAPFAVSPTATAVAVAYNQSDLVADEVLVRVPVSTQKFSYNVYNKEDGFTIPETEVGRKGKPAEVEFGSKELTDQTVDHGLDTPIPNADVVNWEGARSNGNTTLVDPRLRATRALTQCLLTRREKRVADLVTNVANYSADNRIVLSGTSQWSDYANSDPSRAIADVLDGLFMRPTNAVFGRKVWSYLSRHPKICAAVFKNGTNNGLVTRAQFADLFEMPNLPVVGEGWMNTATKGQPVNMQRIWGNDALFFYRDMNADTEYGVTFGITAEFGSRVAGSIVDPDMGIRGGERQRVGESVKELLIAPDLAYLFKNAVN
jgi:hypothetical protein